MLNSKTIKNVLSLALPAVREMILYMMIWVFDTMMVGKYGVNLAASTVGLSSEILYTCVNVFISIGISVGIASLVARSIGAMKKDSAEEFATLGLLSGFFIALIIFLSLFIFCRNILTLAGANEKVIYYGVMFIRIASFGIFFNMLMNILNGILKGLGDTKTPFIVSLISSWFIRIPLIIYFIFILKFSVTYVWWITTVQWCFEGITLLILFNSKLKKYSN